MKSLEIVKANIEVLEEQLDELEDELDKTCFEIELKQLETIKQDLDVLKIIKKKKIDVNDVYICDRYELYIVYMKNLKIAEESILTLEEFNKLKQWLEREEKEND